MGGPPVTVACWPGWRWDGGAGGGKKNVDDKSLPPDTVSRDGSHSCVRLRHISLIDILEPQVDAGGGRAGPMGVDEWRLSGKRRDAGIVARFNDGVVFLHYMYRYKCCTIINLKSNNLRLGCSALNK